MFFFFYFKFFLNFIKNKLKKYILNTVSLGPFLSWFLNFKTYNLQHRLALIKWLDLSYLNLMKSTNDANFLSKMTLFLVN